MKEWYAAREIARLGLPDCPTTERGIQLRAAKEGWPSRSREGRGGGREYHYVMLPRAARIELARREAANAAPQTVANDSLNGVEPRIEAAPAPRLAGLAGTARNRAEARLAVLAALDRYRRAAGFGVRQAEHLFAAAWAAGEIEIDPWVREALPGFSASSLYNWRRLASIGEAAALGGRWKGRREAGKIDGNPVLRDMIVARLLASPHVNAAQIRDGLVAQLPDRKAVPSLRRLQAWITRWKAENAAAFSLASDPDAYKGRFRPSFGAAAENVVRVNQVWELDATPADVMLRDGRHTVVGLIDVFTRRGKVLVTPTSRAASVTALMRRAMLDWGVPETARTDNGKDFTARHVVTALAGLGIHHDLCPPFTPEAKPHIERFLGTLMHDLVEQLPGYIGHDVAGRQAIRNRAAFAKRLGADDADLFAVAMTAAEFQRVCDTWCAAVYARRPHAGLGGRSPFDVAAAHANAAQRIEDERALDILLSPAPVDGGWRVVGKKGLAVEGGTFVAPELAALIGDRVQVRLDAADMGRVLVYGEEGRFVCWAEDPARTGIDRATVAAQARSRRKEIDAGMRAEAARLRREYRPDDAIRDVLAAAEADSMRIVAFPARGEEHATPALDEAAAAARAADAHAASTPLTADDEAAAARQLARMEGKTAEVVSLPPRDSGRPDFADDRVFALWLLNDPSCGEEDDRAWLAERLRSTSFRLWLGIEEGAQGYA